MSIREEVAEVAGRRRRRRRSRVQGRLGHGPRPRRRGAAGGDLRGRLRGRVTTATEPKEVRLELEGHDVRLVRRAHRAQVEQARGRRGIGELRDRAGDRTLRAVRLGRRARRVRSRRPATARGPSRQARSTHEESSALSLRLAVAAALTAPLALLAMVPPLQFSGWEWAALGLATPVVFWSGSGFHRAALQSARHLAATMDTLVSLGTLAAWAWSTVVLVAGLEEDTYFEVAAVITTLILLGRYLEARAKRRSGDAIRKLLELGAKEARVLRDGVEVAVPDRGVAVGDLFVVRPGREDRDRRRRGRGTLRRRPVAARPASRCPSRSSLASEVAGGDAQHLRPARRARDEGRRRHRARADRAPRRGGAVGEGAGAAPRRPHLRGLRPDRDRDRGATLAGWLARRRLRRRRRSRPRSPCSSSPARARSGSRRRRR